jgi:hypothetical protein
MLAAKMDLLMHKLEGLEPSNALDARMTCEHCRNTGHTSKDCPEAQGNEELYFVADNGYRPQGGFNQGWNNHSNLSMDRGGNNSQRSGFSFKGAITNQTRINERISKKLMANDKILEIIDGMMETFHVCPAKPAESQQVVGDPDSSAGSRSTAAERG